MDSTAKKDQGNHQARKQRSGKLIIWQWNSNGFQKKKAQLQQYILQAENTPDVIIIQETLSNEAPTLPGYRSFAKSPPSARDTGSKKGRGVCTLVKKGLIVIEHDLVPRSAIEHVTTEIVAGKRKRRTSITVVNLYSNPRQHKQKFKALIQKTKQIAGDNINFIAGDFNAQHRLWGYPETTEKGQHLLDDMTEMGYQLINDLETTTRNALTSTQRDTNPDLTFLGETTRPLRVKWRNTEETLGSDHKILEIEIPIRGNIKESRQQHIVDWHDYRQKLEANGPETIEDIETWANLLNGTIQSATQTVDAEADGVQIDSRLAHLMEARNSLKNRWKRQRHNRKLRKRIAQLNIEIEKHSKVVCRQQWHAVCQEADGQLHKGKTWKLLRHLLDEQQTKGTQQYILNRTLHKAVTELGEDEVKKRLNNKYLPETPVDPLPVYTGADNALLDADIEEWEVRAVLQSINCKSAPGIDQITNKALRNLSDTAISALTKYFNRCWKDGKLPQQWKTAKTVLIPKPNKPPGIENLRPISLTSCAGKLLEHVLLNRWQQYLEETNIYPDTMLGFRAKLCTQDAMLLLKHEVMDGKTKDNTAVLGLDLQGAFDNVHHSAILKQVSHLNMGRRSFTYIKDFLTGRTAHVVAGDLQLPPKQLGSTGTPQGSVISPLLFNLVMIGVANRLNTIQNVKYTIYADDITIWTTQGSDGQIEAALQEAVSAVEDYLQPTGLKCSPAKSELMLITPRGKRFKERPVDITIKTGDGGEIPKVKTLKVLGLRLRDKGSNEKTLVNELQTKIFRAVRLINKVATRQQGMKEDSLLRLTQSFAISHVAYVASYHNWRADEKKTIDAAIRRAYKSALGLYHHTSTEHMLALGVHNTLEEIMEAQRTAQYQRLAQTRTGRAILKRIGMEIPHTSPKEAAALPRDVLRKIRIPPVPRHMHPQNDQERRTARAVALTKSHANDPHAYYVDVAKYHNIRNAYAAVVINASTGELVTSGSIRCRTPAQAEEYAIVLALHAPDCRTIISDSKTAVSNFSQNNVYPTTARALAPITQNRRLATNVTIKWFPAHAGELDESAGPNRNEEADREAHALTRRGLPSSLPAIREANPTEAAAENENSEEYAITTYGEVLQWYRANRNRYPPPHRDLTRKEATTLRQLQARAIWTPVWAKHVCPEIYHTDTCQRCKKARATQSHILWECSPPAPNTQDNELPDEICSKLISTELGNQRAVVQHVLELLDRQKPGTSSRLRDNG